LNRLICSELAFREFLSRFEHPKSHRKEESTQTKEGNPTTSKLRILNRNPAQDQINRMIRKSSLQSKLSKSEKEHQDNPLQSTHPRISSNSSRRESSSNRDSTYSNRDSKESSLRTIPRETRSQTASKKHIPMLEYPPNATKNKITILREDYDRLEDDEFLNDTIIEFYLLYFSFWKEIDDRYILDHLSEERKNRVHIFNSFFWTNLTRKNAAG
jgi:Ulp1 family protease